MIKLKKRQKKSFSKIREPAVLFLSSDVWKIESIIEEMKWKDEEIEDLYIQQNAFPTSAPLYII